MSDEVASYELETPEDIARELLFTQTLLGIVLHQVGGEVKIPENVIDEFDPMSITFEKYFDKDTGVLTVSAHYLD